ncbi:MAG: hypothetical protein ABIO46_05195 [Chitinophagales bacterium]
MMNSIQLVNQKVKVLLIVLAVIAVTSSCSKEEDAHIPPDVQFKTAAGYTSANATVGQGASVLVGIEATKTEDEMKTFNVSYAFDGSITTTTATTVTLTGTQEESYSTDYTIVTRNQAGTEEWSFTITDRDGNITTKSITLTVQ